MAWFDFIRDILFKLTPYLPGIVGVLIIVSISLILSLLWLFRRAKQRAGSEEEGPPETDEAERDDFAVEPDDLPLLPLKKSFKLALDILRTHVSGRDWRYAIPWYLLIGPEGSGKSTLAASTGMNLPVGAPAADWEEARPGCKWWFFDRGVILDIAGNLVRLGDRRGSGAKGWKLLLSLMDRYRPRRPADGIVLTIPISDLIDREGTPRAPEDVATRAEALYKKLWQAQARLGLAMPVYVVVTKTDRLTGFKEFAARLSPEMLDGILGWSNPNGFDSQFRKQWIAEAMDAVDHRLNDAQLDILARGEGDPDQEEMFRLPEAFAALGENLAIYAAKLFKPSAYHESFALRGIYFTGDSGLARAPSASGIGNLAGAYAGPEATAKEPVFLRDLFERKIFPERGLARPVKRALLSRNRTALGAQLASGLVVVFGALGLWYSLGNIAHGVETVTPFVKQVKDDLRDLVAFSEQRRGAANSDGVFDREKAINLLNGMSEVSIDSFSSVLIPTSLLSDYDHQVVRLTTEAFNRFILQTMRAGLEERGRGIVAGRLPNADQGANADGLALASALSDQAGGAIDEAAGALGLEAIKNAVVAPPARGPAYQRLRRYVEAIRDFEAALARYNTLRDSRDLADIKALVLYLFNIRLSQDFLENATFYETALKAVRYRPIPVEAFAGEARRQFENLSEAALRERYADNPLLVELRELGLALDEAANRHISGIAAFILVTQRIVDVEKLLDAPENAWMGDPDYDPTTAFTDLLERVGGSSLLGPQYAARLNQANIQGVEDVREELPDLRSLILGPLLARAENGVSLELSEPVESFHRLSQGLLKEAFMAEGRSRPLPSAPPAGTGATWNRDRLTEAIDLIGAYDSFMRDRLGGAPPALHGLIRTAAAQRLETVVNDRVASALEGGPDGLSSALSTARAGGSLGVEDRLRREVASMRGAAPAFVSILEAYDTLGLEDSFLDMTDMVMSQALELLDEADDLFAAESLYRPIGGDFSWWDGTPDMALEAFRATDPLHLREQLALQRDRVRVIAEDYAEPLINLLSARDVRLAQRDRVLVQKWQRILDELKKVALSKPENTIAVLERFIAGDLMKVSFSNCAQVLDDAQIGDRSRDYFLARAAALREAVRQRCGDLAEIRAQTAYADIADRFGQDLAGRFPFVAAAYRDGMREVTPRELRRFFETYDRRAEEARAALLQADGLGPEGERAIDFLERMDRVRSVFAPWLASGSLTSAPVYDLTIDFRVNRSREEGGNQVIDWNFSVGDRRVGNLDGARTLRWALGEPIAVTLRWAEDAVRIPALAPDRPELSVNGLTVNQRYEGSWSLFDLVRRHRAGAEDFAEFVDPRPHTLRFRVPTRPVAGGAVEDAVLFIRVEAAATSDGQSEPIEIPAIPVEAPSLLGARG